MRPRQIPLFDDGIPPKRTHHASKLNAGAKRNTQVLEQLKKSGDNGCIGYELAAQLHLSIGQITGALSELHDWGEVRKTDMMRSTPSGADAVVWIAIKK